MGWRSVFSEERECGREKGPPGGKETEGRGWLRGEGMWGRRGWTDRQGAPESIRPASPGTPWRQPLELQAQLGALGSANPVASGTGPWAARARRAWSGDWHPACRPRVFGAQSQCSCLGTGGFAGLSGPPTTMFPRCSWRNTAVRSQQLQGRLRSVWAPYLGISRPQPAGSPGQPAHYHSEFSVARRVARTGMRAARSHRSELWWWD